MNADHERLRELLGEISDGRRVDWDAAAREIPAADRRQVEALQEVERIAEFNRVLQRSDPDPRASTDPPAGSATLENWGPLLLLQQIGRGSHADVYRAWDLDLRREVALKLLREERGAATKTEHSPLMNEARAAASVRHPNIVVVHGIDQHRGRVGMWMELVRGESLEERIRRRGALSPDEVRDLGRAIGSAVAALHDAGVLHRDLKPANVVRDEADRWVLTDFGLGSRAEPGSQAFPWTTGTPMYLAPEVFEGAPHAVGTEVYALGLLLWTALTGRHPFVAEDLAELRARVALGPSPSLGQVCPGAPADLVAAIERAIAPRARERWASAQDFVDALAPAQDAVPPASPSASRTAAPRAGRLPRLAVSMAACLVLFAWVLWRAFAAPTSYDVEAQLVRHHADGGTGEVQDLFDGDRVRPGDQLSLRVRISRPVWVYVLNEDDRGERYLLFPQPLFDRGNPVTSEAPVLLPGTVDGQQTAWTVTSAGGREHFLVVVSPEPVAELEAELERLPAPRPEGDLEYARVDEAALQRLRGVGGIDRIRRNDLEPPASAAAFEAFRSLAGRETAVQGVWVRRLVLQNGSN